MLSESTRASSAEEARFRVRGLPATTRAVFVVALDPVGDKIVARLAAGTWGGVVFVPFSAFSGAAPEAAGAAAACSRSVLPEVASADVVVMIASSGGDARGASVVGEACSLQRVPTTALVVHTAPASDEALSRTLAQVRPWSLMVVVVNDEDYVESILRSFR
jgi:hypothetical protein